ncbi:NAD-P-binding protein [Thelephora terrestris]|uniref:NAD-P-binding protein n=1 Tax=Thelephora terrestris TaxID=56493 RepID=A0A9P6L9N7_9AGAM|nr:NAD-P-binding protein [Thelephora terrestris]
MPLAETKAAFMSSPHFAVVGASKDENKVGTKVLKWYQKRSRDVVPVHPKEAELEGLTTIKSLHELKDPSHTSVSVITPAKVTIEVLKAAKQLNVPAVWCQPGTTDEACETFIKENQMSEKVIFGGPCVLVVGDSILASL